MAKKLKTLTWDNYVEKSERQEKSKIINLDDERRKRNRLSKKETDCILARRKK